MGKFRDIVEYGYTPTRGWGSTPPWEVPDLEAEIEEMMKKYKRLSGSGKEAFDADVQEMAKITRVKVSGKDLEDILYAIGEEDIDFIIDLYNEHLK